MDTVPCSLNTEPLTVAPPVPGNNEINLHSLDNSRNLRGIKILHRVEKVQEGGGDIYHYCQPKICHGGKGWKVCTFM